MKKDIPAVTTAVEAITADIIDTLRGEGVMAPESSVIFFPCKNLDDTVKYYTEVLELPVYKLTENTVWFDCAYGYIAFVEYADGRDMAKGVCISFNLDSKQAVDDMYQKLLLRPVIGLRGAPEQHHKFPVYSFFFSDPNGYTLECQKPF